MSGANQSIGILGKSAVLPVSSTPGSAPFNYPSSGVIGSGGLDCFIAGRVHELPRRILGKFPLDLKGIDFSYPDLHSL